MQHGGSSATVTRRRRFAALILIALILAGWAAFEHFSNKDNEMPASDRAIVAEAKTKNPDSIVRAADALGRLAVHDEADRSDYSRSQFSSGWAVTDGCDMRNRILKRDLKDAKTDHDDCTVLSGVLSPGPYTGNIINFTRGRNTSSAVQIDHVVALSDAWGKGAQDLPKERRSTFANDALNLLAVDGPANMQKGGKDASEWLPRAEYRCRYVARQIAVKLKYELWATRAEHNAMNRVIGTCPEQLLPIVRP